MPGERGLWNLSQRRALLVVIGSILAWLGFKLISNPTIVPDPEHDAGIASTQLADHLDPNTATASELAAIPELGEKRAQAIVDYRDEFLKKHPGKLAFTRPADLERIKGIGEATADNLEQYLKFPGELSRSPNIIQ
jgi:competence ComEA-like helix-hairpin-helix protein